MEPKFLNQYKLTYELYQEWGKHPVGKSAVKNHKKGICLLLSILIAIFSAKTRIV